MVRLGLVCMLLCCGLILDSAAAPVVVGSDSLVPGKRTRGRSNSGGISALFHRAGLVRGGLLNDSKESRNRLGYSGQTGNQGSAQDEDVPESEVETGSSDDDSLSSPPSSSSGKSFIYHTKTQPVTVNPQQMTSSGPSSQSQAVSNDTLANLRILKLLQVVPLQEAVTKTKATTKPQSFETVPVAHAAAPHRFDDEDPPADDPPPDDPPPPTPSPSALFDDGFYHPGYKTIAEAQAAAAAGLFPPFDDGLYHPGFRTWQQAAAAAAPPPPPDPPADDPPADERRRRRSMNPLIRR
ncbi:hypothetical protein OC861_002083 [Tilletia horrida]|nr:hypothetical protein OC845_000075 [Tilletia horrida]KAK0568293.1 hypothetical protein OC861_002083 [Tilletia horrida]